MPPVLGPASPSPTRLKSWAGARATARWPSQTARTESSGPVSPSSMTRVRPASPKASPERYSVTASRASASRSVTSTPLPAASPSVLTTYRPSRVSRKAKRRVGLGEGAVAGGGHAGVDEHLLHPRLGALEAGTVGTGAEHQPAGGPQLVGQAVDQRRLRADDEEVGVDLRRPGCRPSRGCPGCPGVTTTSRCRRRTVARACSRPPEPTTQTFIRPPVEVSSAPWIRRRSAGTARGRGRRRRG